MMMRTRSSLRTRTSVVKTVAGGDITAAAAVVDDAVPFVDGLEHGDDHRFE